MTDEQIKELDRLLMNAYNLICQAEKIIKGSEEHGKRAKLKADKR